MAQPRVRVTKRMIDAIVPDGKERLLKDSELLVWLENEPIAPTHWSFAQLYSLVGASSSYLRELPAPLEGIMPGMAKMLITLKIHLAVGLKPH